MEADIQKHKEQNATIQLTDAQISELKTKLDQEQSKVGKLNGTIRELQQEIENIKLQNSNQVSQQDAKSQEYINQIKQQAAAIANSKEENEKMIQINESLKLKLEEGRNSLIALESQLNESKREVKEKVMKEDYDDIFLQHEAVLAEKEELTKQMLIFVKENQNIKGILSTTIQNSKDCDSHINKLKSDLAKMGEDMALKEQTLSVLKSENDKIKQTLMNDKITELTLRDQITVLKSKLPKK